MRTVSPAITRAVTVCGTGAELVSGSASRTEMCTFAVANCPSDASTRYVASNSPASSGAKYRSRSPVAKRSPPAGSSRRSGASANERVGVLIVVEHGDVDDVARANGDGVGGRDRWLVLRGWLNLDDGHLTLGLGERRC